jgi:hypothetical protein
MEKTTIKSILQEMKTVVENKEIRSPSDWMDWAINLNILWQDLKDEMTKYEMMYKSEIVDKIEAGKKISEATFIVEARSDNYRMYRYLEGRDKLIFEFIKLAKKKASVNDREWMD